MATRRIVRNDGPTNGTERTQVTTAHGARTSWPSNPRRGKMTARNRLAGSSRRTSKGKQTQEGEASNARIRRPTVQSPGAEQHLEGDADANAVRDGLCSNATVEEDGGMRQGTPRRERPWRHGAAATRRASSRGESVAGNALERVFGLVDRRRNAANLKIGSRVQ